MGVSFYELDWEVAGPHKFHWQVLSHMPRVTAREGVPDKKEETKFW